MSLEKQSDRLTGSAEAMTLPVEPMATVFTDSWNSTSDLGGVQADVRLRIGGLRPILIAYARKKVGNEHWAQDAVSATMLAALERPGTFAGRSQLCSWLVGILKHKLVDEIRLSRRNTQPYDSDSQEHAAALHTALTVNDDCIWTRLHRQQSIMRIAKCADSLTGVYRQVFVMKDLHQLETDDICSRLRISNNHFFVLLHRARERVKTCAHASPCNDDASAPSHPRRRRPRQIA
jgi:RNA polymerase sigma factor (sigma-70 family)